MNVIRRSALLARRLVTRNKVTVITALVVALITSGTTAAASYLVLGTTNGASTTTTLKSAVNGAVLSLQNTNSTGGTSARGLAITVPSGRAPITVSSGAGKATNLNADKLDGIDSTGFVRSQIEAWHEIGAVGQPTFICCTWKNFGSGYNTAGFYKDPLGLVHLKGVVQSIYLIPTMGCDTVSMFILPAGYRPSAKVIGPTIYNDTPARIDILPDGEVTICHPTLWQAGDWFSLDGISFRAT